MDELPPKWEGAIIMVFTAYWSLLRREHLIFLVCTDMDFNVYFFC